MSAPAKPRGSWTTATRERMVKALPPDQALPHSQPALLASWIYVFGVATLAALVMIIVSGIALAVGGINWWHTTTVGHFFNSLHLWSVELFFFFMVVHLWGKFFMAAWRGNRRLTRAAVGISFLVYLPSAFPWVP